MTANTPMPPMHVRIAVEEDLPAMCALGLEINAIHHREAPAIFAATTSMERDRAFWRSRMMLAQSRVFLAIRGQQVLGMISARIVQDDTIPFLNPIRLCRIGTICVTAGARSQGIGRALMNAAEAWARHEGASELRLEVFEFNLRAIELYESLGYGNQSRIMSKPI